MHLYQIRFHTCRPSKLKDKILSKLFRSNIIHISVYDHRQGIVIWPSHFNVKPDPRTTYIHALWVQTPDVLPPVIKYSTLGTLLDYFNPFLLGYRENTMNCCSFVSSLCGLERKGKRPVDVYTQLLNLPGFNEGARCSRC